MMRATAVPHWPTVEGGYEPPSSGSRQTKNPPICRQIRPNSFLRGWLRIPVAVLVKALLIKRFSTLTRPMVKAMGKVEATTKPRMGAR